MNKFHICNLIEAMIQRIQSVYLFAVVIFSVLLFFLPISTKITDAPERGISYKMTSAGITKYAGAEAVSFTPGYAPLILNMLLLILSAIIIFLYKNRNIQIALCRLCLLLSAALVIASFYLTDKMDAETGAAGKLFYLSGSYFPLLQIILLLMAMRAIKKDQELVQSADRIR